MSSWSWEPGGSAASANDRQTGGKRRGEAGLSGVLARPGQVLLDQRVRELPLGVGELDAVSLERGRLGTARPELLPLESQGRDALLERLHAEAPPLTPEAARCNGPQSRSAHPYRTIDKKAQMSSPQTGHFAAA